MLFLANNLLMHGGTTFLERVVKEMASRGLRPKVLILMDKFCPDRRASIQEHAEVMFLSELSPQRPRFLHYSQLGSMLVPSKEVLNFFTDAEHVHVFGLFGLRFALDVKSKLNLSREMLVSAGVYHQNEYMFSNVGATFALILQEKFLTVPTRHIVFFNDNNRKTYSDFFSKTYDDSPLLPIGINRYDDIPLGDWRSRKIVTIGNLHKFKTYIMQMINIMHQLIEVDRGFTYEIYGSGPEQDVLADRIKDLNLEQHVFLKGQIRYEEIDTALSGAFVFLGGGTAVIEASAKGVPSLVGVESLDDASSNGFFGDVVGFDYNEASLGCRRLKFFTALEELCSSEAHWLSKTRSGVQKSKEFSITSTVDGLLRIDASNSVFSISDGKPWERLIFICSWLKTAMLSVLGVESAKSFQFRRNQSSN